jgi:hypothetical protein
MNEKKVSLFSLKMACAYSYPILHLLDYSQQLMTSHLVFIVSNFFTNELQSRNGKM